ncbi:coiled-coil domain-containing protein 7 [Ochotona princeps]|uniref:coiled-coil domain-containing protein 7 n=1 Tax=Ochotona princeps TaxID=9978 RepID=UPI00271478BA|nr:coiled-coil domain-containing protein 7 [Ochotona princeps]XP_058525562.1 coiled-coil domain-containing protein 7 [Ochotona princeps]XP_058525563.1 coiled-coil domain-containing protein 7 [Ochotona princeps]XP_058525564.1 coiled-coil domain-containing protein 7 [Ochotona princeps]XP_058525565.1 coiled-coil domain-containing protein 7 [Ochotona princeps]XP_058525566.1 coiled-coil domain-containing protein 7 [Ochotona princeps]XP_058525567.1 coiled-coil domain-containing protein 7 [Ochotona 
MKPSKQLAASSNTLPSASDPTNKKGQLNSSPQPKEKCSEKLVDNKIESMALRVPPPTTEFLTQYALPAPLNKTKQFVMKDERIKAAAKHLEMLVSSLEETYGTRNKKGGKAAMKSDNEELNLSVGDDMNLFLQRCSQLATQLEDAVKEEHNVLDTVFKWFQQQVNQMEEISKDQTPLEELLAPDPTVSSNITQTLRHEQKLEELRNRLHQVSESLDTGNPSTSSPESPTSVRSYESIEQQIQDAANLETHRLEMMLKMLEKQSHMLGKAIKDRDSLQTKCQQMQDDFELLSEEKMMLENELYQLKGTERGTSADDPTKKGAKVEKKKEKDADGKMSSIKQAKIKELLKAQKTAGALEVENKILQEKLKQALQEAERTRNQLDYLLSQEKSKTALEMDVAKTEVKDEDLKNQPSYQVPDTNESKIIDNMSEHSQTPAGSLRYFGTVPQACRDGWKPRRPA